MSTDRKATFRCARLATAALALGIFTSAGLASASAQDATPAASPATVSCDSPGLPPGTPTPMDDMAGMDMSSPEAMEGMEMASPEAIEEAPATGTEADEATSAAVLAVLENYAACYNEGQATGDPGLYVALESQNFVESQGYATRYDRAADELGSPFSTATVLDAGNVQTWDDGRVSVDAQILVGDYWLNHWTIYFVQGENGTWLYDEEVNLPPNPDVDFVAVNGINITETKDESSGDITYAFVSYSGSWDFTESDAIIFNFTNSGQEPHEAIVMQLPEGVDPMGILDGSVDMSQVNFIGGVFDIAPGASADLTLLHLPVGTYTMICFFPAPDGAPHAAHGMIQQFNIVAAEG
ncbi:MAG TPA: hypothetical protein VFP05_12775 [Thermomicrobiales bacterium]|nr:hypothetical protein [Thermomicrobiales bacterium]